MRGSGVRGPALLPPLAGLHTLIDLADSPTRTIERGSEFSTDRLATATSTSLLPPFGDSPGAMNLLAPCTGPIHDLLPVLCAE